MQNSRVASDLLKHLAHQRQILTVCLLQLPSHRFEVGFQPFLTVIKVSVLIFDYTFGNLTRKWIGYRNIDVIGRNCKGLNQNGLNQKTGCDLAFS